MYISRDMAEIMAIIPAKNLSSGSERLLSEKRSHQRNARADPAYPVKAAIESSMTEKNLTLASCIMPP